MKPELPIIGQDDPEAPLPATEVEYALILSQMIEVAEQDPSQLRLAIYEFARAKLIYNTMNAKLAEKERLAISLEAAIAGVENFSRRRLENRRMVFSHEGTELADLLEKHVPQPMLEKSEPASAMREESVSAAPPKDALLSHARTAWDRAPQLNWFAIVLFIFVAVAGLVLFMQRSSPLRDDKKATASVASPEKKDAGSRTPDDVPKKNDAAGSDFPPASIPLPNDYGIYAVNGSTLLQLQPLAEQVPDKRIEMSTPITQVSQVTISDGAAKFIIYRRDFASDAPDRVEVRVVARVSRVVRFDAKGKPIFSPAPSSWIMRNIVYEFKVRPIPGRPEMLMVQAKDSALALPSGRYVISLKDRGYDFNVAGQVVDPAQCVERTDAMNGSFYSDCQQ